MPRWLPGTRSDHASTAAVTSSTASLFAYQVEALTLHVTLPPSLRLSRTLCFLCDAGVADQLQTNYASDLRSILKTLFEVMATKCEQGDNDKQKKGEEKSGLYVQYSLCFSPGSKHKQQSIAHSTDCAFYVCGVQQVLFCAVQCWRTALSVRRPSPHQRWQPRPGRASLKVSKSTCHPVQVLLKC